MKDEGRIALFLPSLRGGGAERMMVNLARGFTERGIKTDLVLARAEGPYLSQVPSNINVVDLGASRVLACLPALIQYLRKVRPKSMLSTLGHANIVAIWAKKLSGVSTRLVVREANTITYSTKHASTKGKFISALVRKFYPSADVIVAVSNGVADDLARYISLPRQSITTIYNPVITPDIFVLADAPLEHPWFAPGAPPVILGVGRLTRQKDFPTLIKAFARVRKEKAVRLLILGEGEERPKLQALVNDLGLRDDVSMPGFVKNPFNYMRQSSVFVLSSAWEGLPGVLIQAMACGTPVVSTDCPSGPAEILEGGRYGPLVPVGDEKKLAEAINNILNESNCPNVMKRAHDFEMDKIVERYLNVLFGYDEVV